MNRYIIAACFFIPAPAMADIVFHPGGSGTVTFQSGGSGTVVFETTPTVTSCSGFISSDTFTEGGAGDILLNTHTSDSGDAWLDSIVGGVNVVHLDTSNDVVKSTVTSPTSVAYVDETLCSANYYVQATGQTGSTGSNRYGVVFHHDPATDNGYDCRVTGGGAIELRRSDAGTTVVIGSTTVGAILGSFTVSTFYTLKVVTASNVHSVYINDTIALVRGDSTYPDAYKAGILVSGTAPRTTSFEAGY